MASESSTDRSMSITVPAELEDWLDEQAAAAGVGSEQFLIQLLTAYRETADMDASAGAVTEDELTSAVEAELESRLAALDESIDERIEAQVDETVTERISEATTSVQRQLTDRIESVESEFDGKIDDVRDRVIQVKREADGKAPADHTHEQLSEVQAVADRLDEIEAELDSLRSEFETVVPDHDEGLESAESRLDRMEDRLQTIAWVVSDLREAQGSSGGLETVERIKRAAAKADIQRANCENCGESVLVSLLTDPKCPHCDATVSNVEPAGGWFGKPKLVTASQLESGESE
jgi:DNA repair exonuclease SbcCD ATPase subunit